MQMSASEAAEHPWLGGLVKAEVNRAKASAALEPREQNVKAEKEKLLGGEGGSG